MSDNNLVEDSKSVELTPALRIFLIDRILHEKHEEGGIQISDFDEFIDRYTVILKFYLNQLTFVNSKYILIYI